MFGGELETRNSAYSSGLARCVVVFPGVAGIRRRMTLGNINPWIGTLIWNRWLVHMAELKSLVCKRRRGVEENYTEDIDRGPDLTSSQSPAVGSPSRPSSLAHAISGSLPFRASSTSVATEATPTFAIGSELRPI